MYWTLMLFNFCVLKKKKTPHLYWLHMLLNCAHHYHLKEKFHSTM